MADDCIVFSMNDEERRRLMKPVSKRRALLCILIGIVIGVLIGLLVAPFAGMLERVPVLGRILNYPGELIYQFFNAMGWAPHGDAGWGMLILAFYIQWPVTEFIIGFLFGMYQILTGSGLARKRRTGRGGRGESHE